VRHLLDTADNTLLTTLMECPTDGNNLEGGRPTKENFRCRFGLVLD
jgi:hypothetical protein